MFKSFTGRSIAMPLLHVGNHGKAGAQKVVPDEYSQHSNDVFTSISSPNQGSHCRNCLLLTLLVSAELVFSIASSLTDGSSRSVSQQTFVTVTSCLALVCGLTCWHSRSANMTPKSVEVYEGVLSLATCCVAAALLIVNVSASVSARDRATTRDTSIVALLPIVLDFVFPSLASCTLFLCCAISLGCCLGTALATSDARAVIAAIRSVVMSTMILVARRTNVQQWTRDASGAMLERASYIRREASEELARRWRGILAGVAHDLETPLAALATGIDVVSGSLAALPTDMSPRTRAGAETASAGTRSLQSVLAHTSMVVHRYLDYSKFSGGVPLVPFVETVDVRDCLRHAMQCVTDLQPCFAIELAPLPADMGGPVCTDQRWLLENAVCLLENAAKHAPRSHKVVMRVRIDAAQRWEHGDLRSSLDTESCSKRSEPATDANTASLLVVEVEDEGEGLTESQRRAMFLDSKHAPRMSGGTGLGLVTVAHRCNALGGGCGVRDRQDGKRGNVFWFSVSAHVIADRCSGDLDGGGSPCSDALSPSGPASLSVLLAEDALPVSKMLRRLLEQDGHVVAVAHNGAQAVEMACRADVHFDAILMDMQMPLMDGVAATRHIRTWEAQQSASDVQLPDHASRGDCGTTASRRRSVIVGCSANCDDQTISDALEAGVDDFMPKPFRLKKFKELVGHRLHF